MNAYIYNAALYCEECGKNAIDSIVKAWNAPADINDESSFDSDDFPKGPYSDGGGEADSPQHCDDCGVFLENPLTVDGREYLSRAIDEDIRAGRTKSVAIEEWAPFYCIA